MNSEHNIRDLDLLYSDAQKIINGVIGERLDTSILKSITDAITNIKEYWHGQDATIQVNRLIDTKNLLLDNRDILGNIGVYISMLAKNYRDAQNANGTVLPSFNSLEYKPIAKNQKIESNSQEVYMNNNISNIITILNSIASSIEELNSNVALIRNSIFNNWVKEDENRNYALKMFDKFTENEDIVIKNIDEIIKCITTSIENYNFSLAGVSSIPSLESMMNDTAKQTEKAYTQEEQQILNGIEKNFKDNQKITETFNNTLREEIKKDLMSKGILE